MRGTSLWVRSDSVIETNGSPNRINPFWRSDSPFLQLSGKLGEPIEGDTSKIRTRAEDLLRLGFGVADAAHVAFAEYSGAQFISCDEKLLKKCLTHKIKIWFGNPVAFCEREGLR